MHLTFWSRIAGNFMKRDVRMVDRVEGLIGPIGSWDDSLDVQAVRQLAVGQSHVACDELQVYSTADLSWNQLPQDRFAPHPKGDTLQSDAWELKAQGNVHFERREPDGMLDVTANQAHYVANRSELLIEGESRRPAVFRIQKGDDVTGQNSTQVSSALFDTRTMQVKQLRIQNATFNLPASMQPNLPAGAPQPSSVQRPGPPPRESMQGAAPLPSPRFHPR
jgi:hypothetical protein